MVNNASDQITIDVGGRIFKTSKTTLENARYFQSLLGNSGIGAGDSNNNNHQQQNNNNSSAAVPTPFIDRDPDLFDEVLYYLRSNKLRAKTKVDAAKLVDLQHEAEFFSFDEMAESCKQAIQALKKAFKPPPEDPPAVCYPLKISKNSPDSIPIKRGQVAYVVSATLTGTCQVNRYRGHPDEDDDGDDDDDNNRKSKNIPGCYLKTCKVEDKGDFQLQAELNGDYISLAHVGMDHIHVGDRPLNLDFRQDLRMCLRHEDEPDDDEDPFSIEFRATGSGTWDVIVWVGKPDKIPGLQQQQHERPRKRPRLNVTNAGNDDEDDEATTAMSIMALGLIAGLF